MRRGAARRVSAIATDSASVTVRVARLKHHQRRLDNKPFVESNVCHVSRLPCLQPFLRLPALAGFGIASDRLRRRVGKISRRHIQAPPRAHKPRVSRFDPARSARPRRSPWPCPGAASPTPMTAFTSPGSYSFMVPQGASVSGVVITAVGGAGGASRETRDGRGQRCGRAFQVTPGGERADVPVTAPLLLERSTDSRDSQPPAGRPPYH